MRSKKIFDQGALNSKMIQKNWYHKYNSQFELELEKNNNEEQNISKSWYFAIPVNIFLSIACEYWEKVHQIDW